MERAAAAAAAAGDGFGRLLLAFLLIAAIFLTSGVGAFVGVNINYPAAEAESGSLPKPELVVDLLNILQIQQIKLYPNTHYSFLEALSGTDIQVLLTYPPSLQSSEAPDWLRLNVIRYSPSVKVAGVVVTGTPDDRLVETVKNLYSSVSAAGLGEQIKVTASLPSELIISGSVLSPSSAAFKPAYAKLIHQLLELLAAADSYLMIEAEPYEAVLRNECPLELAISSTFQNFLDAALDSVHTAMEKLGFSDLPLVVGSIGWPWRSNSSLASPENAAVFTAGLVKRCLTDKATLKRPGSTVGAYLRQLFHAVDESGSPEFGLFGLDQVPAFRFDLTTPGGFSDEEAVVMRRVLADNNTGNGTSTGGTGGTGGTGQYCVAKTGAADNVLSVGLNWACGQGNADCSAIQQNGACYLPDTYASHASFAFNSYWQKNSAAGATCDFQGAAMLTSTDPSYNSCIYTSSSGTSGGGGTGGSTGSGGSSSSSGGILQPFNPSGNSSSAGSPSLRVEGATLIMAAFLLWSWRI